MFLYMNWHLHYLQFLERTACPAASRHQHRQAPALLPTQFYLQLRVLLVLGRACLLLRWLPLILVMLMLQLLRAALLWLLTPLAAAAGSAAQPRRQRRRGRPSRCSLAVCRCRLLRAGDAAGGQPPRQLPSGALAAAALPLQLRRIFACINGGLRLGFHFDNTAASAWRSGRGPAAAAAAAHPRVHFR